MTIILYIIGIVLSILILIWTLLLENDRYRSKCIKKIKEYKKSIPIIRHWDEESVLRQIQQRFFLASMITTILFVFVIFKYLL